jgi:putative transcriptional regulator
MKVDFDLFKINNQLSPETGKVIISEPLSDDGFFGRSVVLLNEHNSNGTVGFILNKPSKFTVDQFLDSYKELKLPVYIGGPVANDTLHFIHKSKGLITDSVKITKDLYWGGNMNELPELIENQKIFLKDIKFFIGYSGWDADQLAKEIGNNFWVVTSLDSSMILTNQVKDLWSRAVKKAGDEYKFWLNIPDDIIAN